MILGKGGFGQVFRLSFALENFGHVPQLHCAIRSGDVCEHGTVWPSLTIPIIDSDHCITEDPEAHPMIFLSLLLSKVGQSFA